jgi:hypothetical protein
MLDIDTVHKELNAGIHIDLDTYARACNDRTFFLSSAGPPFEHLHSTEDDAKKKN